MSEQNGLRKGWAWSVMSEVCEKIQDGTHFSPDQERQLPKGKYPYVTAKNVRPHGLDLTDITYLEEEEHRQIYGRCDPHTGDVLLVKDGVNTGDAAINTVDGEISLLSSVCMLRPRKELLSNKFLRYFLLSPQGYRSLTGQMTGTAIKRIILRKIRDTPVPIAPMSEQRRIVAKVEELISDLDAGVAALERIRANLKRYRAAVLKAAVEGRLTEEWRARHPKTESASKLLERILAERRKKWEGDQLAKFAAADKSPPKGWKEKYFEPVPPDTSGLPKLPQGWCWATVEQVSEFARYGSSAKTTPDCAGVPVLRMGNIQDGSLDLGDLKYLPHEHDEFPDLLLRESDLLFNRTNSAELVGKSAIYRGIPNPCSYASYLISVRMMGGCNSGFVCYYLNSWHGRAWIASVVSQQVGQANVNGTKLQALLFPLPPENEQTAIVAEVELRFSNIAAAEAQVDANLKRAARLRQSILKRAFEGKLVPQDPTDESAEKLLERIRLERSTMENGKQPQQRRQTANGSKDEPNRIARRAKS